MAGYGHAQDILTKKVEAMGQAVAKLTTDFMRTEDAQQPPPQHQGHLGVNSHGRHPFSFGHVSQDNHVGGRNYTPKLSFPRFDGQHPKIWKDKCLDYFQVCNVPKHMWVTTASLHLDDNAAKWLQMYKLKHGLGSWVEFIHAVEEQFGSDDYRSALDELLVLKQRGTVEEYATEFESLQFQICMHNSGYGELFFVAQFIKGLRPDIQSAIQMQLPDKVTKAILLAKIQQKMLEKGKYKAQRTFTHGNTRSLSAEMILSSPVLQVHYGGKDRNKIIGRLMGCVIIVLRNVMQAMRRNVPRGQNLILML